MLDTAGGGVGGGVCSGAAVAAAAAGLTPDPEAFPLGLRSLAALSGGKEQSKTMSLESSCSMHQKFLALPFGVVDSLVSCN